MELELFWIVVSSFLYLSSAEFFADKTWIAKYSGATKIGKPESMFKCSRPSEVFLISFLANRPSAFHTARATLPKLVRLLCLDPAWCSLM